MKRNKQAALFAFIVVFVVPLALFFYWFNKERPTIEALPIMDKFEVNETIDSLGNAVYDTIYESISDFQLVSHMGDTVNRASIDGKIVVAGFFFTRCKDLCTDLAANLAYLQNAFADQDSMLLLLHTVDPVNDSVPALYEYSKQYQVNPRKWMLLTGEKDELYRLAIEEYMIQVQKDDIYEFNYSAHDEIHESGDAINQDGAQLLNCERLILLDKEGHRRGYYLGTDMKDIERLRVDIARLFLISDFPHTRQNSLNY